MSGVEFLNYQNLVNQISQPGNGITLRCEEIRCGESDRVVSGNLEHVKRYIYTFGLVACTSEKGKRSE